MIGVVIREGVAGAATRGAGAQPPGAPGLRQLVQRAHPCAYRQCRHRSASDQVPAVERERPLGLRLRWLRQCGSSAQSSCLRSVFADWPEMCGGLR